MTTRITASLLAIALVAAACGGGSDDSSEATTTASASDDSAASDEPSSDDGVSAGPVSAGALTVWTPDGSAITVAETVLEPTVADLTQLAAWELGPDGAEFGEPVRVELEVTEEQLSNGVLAVLHSSDGSTEPVALDIGPDGSTVVGEIAHFSTLEFFQGQIDSFRQSLDELWWAPGWTVDELTAAGYERLLEEAIEGANQPQPLQWTVVKPLPPAEANLDMWMFLEQMERERACEGGAPADAWGRFAPGPAADGSLEWRPADIELVEPFELPGVFQSLEGLEQMCEEARKGIESFLDNCLDLISFVDAEGCPTIENVSYRTGPAGLALNITAGAADGADVRVIVGMDLAAADGSTLQLQCTHGEPCRAWFGPGFEFVSTPWDPATATITDDELELTFSVVPGPNGEIQFDVPDLETTLGTEAGAAAMFLTNMVLWTETPELQGTFELDELPMF